MSAPWDGIIAALVASAPDEVSDDQARLAAVLYAPREAVPDAA